MALPPNAVSKIVDTEQAVEDIVMNNFGVMPDGLTPNQQEEFSARQRAALQNADQTVGILTDTQEEVTDVLQDAAPLLPLSSRKTFELSKFSQGFGMPAPAPAPAPATAMPDPMMSDPTMPDPMMADPAMAEEDPNMAGQPTFETHIDLYNWLEGEFDSGVDISETRSTLISMAGEAEIIGEEGLPIEPAEVIASGLTDYAEAININKPEERATIAKRIFDVMPQKDTANNEVTVVQETVAETNSTLQRLAIELAQHNQGKTASATKSFNLSKTAQHKGMENVIMHTPGGNRIDPITGYLISDWHIYERNKGWGLRAGDAIGIDYETLWRENIMDKYSRAYRDKDGNWVGGYIQKRFEVDKWIPETNNLQLKPGQRRKPYIAEFRSHEARLQDLRSKEDDRGRVFNDTSKPFNWKEASCAKKKAHG